MTGHRGGKMGLGGVGKEGDKPGKARLKGGRRDRKKKWRSQNWQPFSNCQSPTLSLGGCDRQREPGEK